MKQDFDVFFHLGLPKTASTFLQYNFFPMLNDVKYFPKKHFKKYHDLKPEPGKKYLFTSEKDRNFEKAIAHISQKFPQAKIILVFRRHDDWIKSKYKYYIRKYGHRHFDDFFDMEENKGLWKREDLYYQNKIQIIEKYLENQPLILTFDELKTNPQNFIDQIADYMETTYEAEKVDFNVVKKNFGIKKLIILRKFNRAYKFKEEKYKKTILKKVYGTYRKFLLHIVAFFAGFLPQSAIKNEKLIEDEAQLKKIRNYYKNDWEFCKNYS